MNNEHPRTENADQRFPARLRVRRPGDFRRVYDRDVVAADATLVVAGAENDLPYPRLGITVSRKVGNAVLRNRWKRLIREAFRTQRLALPAGVDLVVRSRRGASPDAAAIRQSLCGLARRVRNRLLKLGRLQPARPDPSA